MPCAWFASPFADTQNQPDITFFGEDLPDEFGHRLLHHDRDQVDLVIVIGTSLKVAPVAEVPGVLPRTVPQIYISRTVSQKQILFFTRESGS